MAEFIIVFGFFLVLIIEQVVLDCKERWLNNDSKQEQIRTTNPDYSDHPVLRDSHDEIDETSSLIGTPSESVSATLTPERITNSNSTHRRKSNGKGYVRKNYGSTINPSPFSTQQTMERSEEESLQENNNDNRR